MRKVTMHRRKTYLNAIPCKVCGSDIHFIEMKGDGHMMPCDTKLQKLITRKGNLVEGYRSHYSNCSKVTGFKE